MNLGISPFPALRPLRSLPSPLRHVLPDKEPGDTFQATGGVNPGPHALGPKLRRALLLSALSVGLIVAGCAPSPKLDNGPKVEFVQGGPSVATPHEPAAPIDAEALRGQGERLLTAQGIVTTPSLTELMAVSLWERGLPTFQPSPSNPVIPALGVGYNEMRFTHNLSEEQKQSFVGDYTARLASGSLLSGLVAPAVMQQLQGKFKPEAIWADSVSEGKNRWQTFGTFQQQLQVDHALQPSPPYFKAGALKVPVYGTANPQEEKKLTQALQYIYERAGAKALEGLSEIHVRTILGRMLDERGQSDAGVGGQGGSPTGEIILARGPLADYRLTLTHELGHNLDQKKGVTSGQHPFGKGVGDDDFASAYAHMNPREDLAETHVLLLNSWELVTKHPQEALQGTLGEKLGFLAKAFYDLQLPQGKSARYDALVSQVEAGKTPFGGGTAPLDFVDSKTQADPLKDMQQTQLYLLRHWRELHETPSDSQAPPYMAKVRWLAQNLFGETLPTAR